MKKVLIIVSNANSIGPNNRRTGIFLPEVAHPYAEFAAANYQVDFASLTQKLNELGDKGWEVVSNADTNMWEGASRGMVIILKREKR